MSILSKVEQAVVQSITHKPYQAAAPKAPAAPAAAPAGAAGAAAPAPTDALALVREATAYIRKNAPAIGGHELADRLEAAFGK